MTDLEIIVDNNNNATLYVDKHFFRISWREIVELMGDCIRALEKMLE